MLSHVIEYACQYTNQTRKKHKAWHDGRLKYFSLHNRFLLYTDNDNVMLASSFISNKRDLAKILNIEEFGREEHKIFAQFMVIIAEIISEYDKDVQISRVNNNTRIDTNTRVDAKDSLRGNKVARTRKLIIDNDLNNDSSTNSLNGPSLTLKFNKPFRKPRIAMYTNEANSLIINKNNRPTFRNALVKTHESKRINKNTMEKFLLTAKMELKSSSKVISSESENTSVKSNKNKYKIGKGSKIRKIGHEPIILL